MPSPFKFGLPSKKDWAWVVALVLIGGALGFAMNAVSGVGINLRIALNLDAPPAGAAAPAGEQP
ncbi:MAG: hypothetical protein ACREKE_07095 [bacterium]